MSHVFHQLYYHFVWTTHSREPLITKRWRSQLLETLNDVRGSNSCLLEKKLDNTRQLN